MVQSNHEEKNYDSKSSGRGYSKRNIAGDYQRSGAYCGGIFGIVSNPGFQYLCTSGSHARGLRNSIDLDRGGTPAPADVYVALQIAAGGSVSCDTATSTAADCQWRWQCNIPRRWILIMRLVLARVLVAAASATPVAIARHQDSEKNARQTWL